MAYTRMAQRAQALACFLAPALLVLAYILLGVAVLRTGVLPRW